ncbi:hypothetical protein AVEN_57538-1 [Araneus ventricosus]|uniref:Uncharacterized protein n=1 Tax=Araneus ventricosus TaxID=182803 RepID=A0A4Y2V3H0_ARAVE|nr:hypothetical protein AVEN_57538-1 [Araneus ventricosus]
MRGVKRRRLLVNTVHTERVSGVSYCFMAQGPQMGHAAPINHTERKNVESTGDTSHDLCDPNEFVHRQPPGLILITCSPNCIREVAGIARSYPLPAIP